MFSTDFGKRIFKRGPVAACCRLTALLCLLTASNARAVVFDGGVDPANLGKGEWIYIVSAATNKLNGYVPVVTNTASLMDYLRTNLRLQYIVVKAGDDGTPYPSGNPQFTTNLVSAAHSRGLKIFGYTRCWGNNVPGIVTLAGNVFNCGADGFILDAEDDWVNTLGANAASNAWWVCGTIKTNWPSKFLAHSPICNISGHSSFPYKEFGYWCDAVMPQVYWVAWGKANRSWKDPLTGQYYYQVCTPAAGIGLMDAEWRAFQNSLVDLGNTSLGTSWTNAIKPLVPIGQADSPGATNWTGALNQTFADMTNFVWGLKNDSGCVTAGGYKGCCFFAIGESSGYGQDTGMLGGIAAASIGERTIEIYAQPVDQTVMASRMARFEVVAQSVAPLQYRWHKNGSPLIDQSIVFGSATPSLTLLQVFAAYSADYTVVLSNSFQSVTSAVSKLTVIDPCIKVQPSSKTAGAGETVVISADGVGTYPFTWKWRKNGIVITNHSDDLGKPTSYLTLTNLGAGDAASYSAIIQNPFGSVTSSVATLTLTNLPAAPVITSQPSSQTVALGSNAVFSVTATASSPYGYQWLWNGEKIAGATASKHTITNVVSANAGTYNVVITNAVGTNVSSDAVLVVGYTLSVMTNGYGTVAKSPDLGVYSPGTVVTLTAVPKPENAWLGWAGDMLGTNTPATIVMDATKSVTAVFSRDALIVDNRERAWSYSVGWTSITNSNDVHTYGPDYKYCLGKTNVASSALVCPNIEVPGYYDVYIWYQEGPDRTTGACWSVFCGSDESLTYVNQQINGGQWVKIGSKKFPAGVCGCAEVTSKIPDYSPTVTKKIIVDAVKFAYCAVQIPPSITSQPQSRTLNSGDSAGLSVEASGDALFFQWYKDQFPLSDSETVAGSSTAHLILNNVALSDCAAYRVVVSNAIGAVTSQWATVTMLPSIVTHPTNATVVSDGSATFSVSAMGSAPLGYHWRKDGSLLNDGGSVFGTTNNTLTLNHVSQVDAGVYSVIVTNTAGTAVSSNAVLVVIPRPQFGSPFVSNSHLWFNLTGEPGANYAVETSTNLLDWIYATNLVATNGSCEFGDPMPDLRRFFRAVKVPE